MKKAAYTDAVQETQQERNDKQFELLPDNKFCYKLDKSVPYFYTDEHTTANDLVRFSQRQQEEVLVYVFHSIRDGLGWLESELLPFAEKHERFGPLVIIDLAINRDMQLYLAPQRHRASLGKMFRGMFVGFENVPLDLEKVLALRKNPIGANYFNG